MNTGVQRSSATPPAARTARRRRSVVEPGNPFGQGKDVPRSRWRTARIRWPPHGRGPARPGGQGGRAPWCCAARATSMPGAVPARLGQSGRLRRPDRPAGTRGAVPRLPGAGWRGDRARHHPPTVRGRGVPATQKRSAHLFTHPDGPAMIARLQELADRNIARYGLRDPDGEEHHDGQAIRDHARRRLVAGQPHGVVAHRAT